MRTHSAGKILARAGREWALYGKRSDRMAMGVELTSGYSAQIFEL